MGLAGVGRAEVRDHRLRLDAPLGQPNGQLGDRPPRRRLPPPMPLAPAGALLPPPRPARPAGSGAASGPSPAAPSSTPAASSTNALSVKDQRVHVVVRARRRCAAGSTAARASSRAGAGSRRATEPTTPQRSPSSMNGPRMNQFVAPTSFITSISRRRAKIESRIVFAIRSVDGDHEQDDRDQEHERDDLGDGQHPLRDRAVPVNSARVPEPARLGGRARFDACEVLAADQLARGPACTCAWVGVTTYSSGSGLPVSRLKVPLRKRAAAVLLFLFEALLLRDERHVLHVRIAAERRGRQPAPGRGSRPSCSRPSRRSCRSRPGPAAPSGRGCSTRAPRCRGR